MRCSIVYDMWQYTQTFLSGPWPREIGIAVLSCPAYQGRMVGNTKKCSINAPFFVLPDCRTSLSYDYYLLRVFFLPSHLLFSWRHCCCMDNWTTWCPPGLQDCRSGHWTAGISCLEGEWQGMASGGRALIRIGDGS